MHRSESKLLPHRKIRRKNGAQQQSGKKGGTRHSKTVIDTIEMEKSSSPFTLTIDAGRPTVRRGELELT